MCEVLLRLLWSSHRDARCGEFSAVGSNVQRCRIALREPVNMNAVEPFRTVMAKQGVCMLLLAGGTSLLRLFLCQSFGARTI